MLEVEVERPLARAGAWYELFPRSWGGLAGTAEVIPALAELGFDVEGDRCHLRGLDVVLTGLESGSGIHGWGWRGVEKPAVGDIPTLAADREPTGTGAPHPNQAVGLFYVVLFGPSWAEAAEALAALGVDPGEPRPMGPEGKQVLRSVAPAGEVSVEVIGPAEHDPNREWNLWGTIVEVADIDATASRLGDRLRAVKPAMQKGRRIATLDKTAGSSVALAFMSPLES